MLCREKRTGTRVGTSVIAACGECQLRLCLHHHGAVQLTLGSNGNAVPGIFVNDILEAVPIDKYFELFKPGAAGEGGFIRIGIDYEDHTRRRGQANGGRQSTPFVPISAPKSGRSSQQMLCMCSALTCNGGISEAQRVQNSGFPGYRPVFGSKRCAAGNILPTVMH